jgi:hypothetical protein
VEGTATGELVDGWLVVRFAAGGAGLEGRGLVVLLRVVVVGWW